jgi:NAD dependent epimerase/dehydratase family enzyme
MPAPGFALRAVLGEMASMILDSQRMLPAKACDLGFTFSHPQLEPALRTIYSS